MKDSSSMSHSSSKEEDEVIDLSLVLRKLAQQKAVIITGCLLGIALAVLLHLFSPPLYRAIATLEVRPQKNELFGETLSSGDLAINSVNEAEMETAAAKLTRDAFLTLVSNHPSIVSCENLIPKDNGFLSGEYTSSTERKEIFLSWFRKESIKVMPRPGTLLLDITVEHRDPRSASIIANTILEVALDEARKSRGDESTTMIDELVQDYKELATRLSISRTRLSVYDDAKKLRQEILEGRSDVSLLKGRYKSKHPSMIAATSKVAQLEILLREEIEAIRVSPSEKDYWDSNLSENEGSHGHFIPFLDARLAFLDSEVKNLSETYNSVVAEAAAAQIANDTTSSDLKTFQLAPFEGSDAGFSLIILLLGGFILGTGSGLFLAIVRGYVLEKGIRNRIEWSQNFQIPLLGELLYHNDDQLTPWELIEGGSADMNQYYQTESIRSVRAQITLLGRASDKKRLLIASALPEEGKTTLATSLALSFARLKAPTLLIDLDLRKPSVHEALRLPNEMGMSDLLTEKASAKDVIQELEDGALHVITGGALIPHAPELLSTTTLEEILDELSPSYERIIIDSAPLLPVADTKLIAPFADCSLLAVRANRTELPSIETTLVELGAAGSQVAGAVLNFVRVSDAKSTQERSGYGYAYGQPSVSKS